MYIAVKENHKSHIGECFSGQAGPREAPKQKKKNKAAFFILGRVQRNKRKQHGKR